MITAIEFMLAPFVVCILLIGINIYFGIHVIKREIIFIDIALAQIAAFGGTIATIFHALEHDHAGHSHDEHSLMGYLFAIAFTTLAAAMFTFLKSKRLPIPLEAIIGISYAVATTGAKQAACHSTHPPMAHMLLLDCTGQVRWAPTLVRCRE